MYNNFSTSLTHTNTHTHTLTHTHTHTHNQLALYPRAPDYCTLQTHKTASTSRLHTCIFLNDRILKLEYTSTLDLLTVRTKFVRGPHVAQQQQKVSIDICCGPAPDLSSKPAGPYCRCRSTGQTDGRKDTRPLYDA